MKYIELSGRIFYSLIFMLASITHFSAQTIGYAASQGVPFASTAVPISGIISLLGGISVALGYKTKYGAWLLVLFLVPVTVMLHNFWMMKDPMMAQMQQAMFMKNLAMLGGALVFAYFGAGPLSLDARAKARSTVVHQGKQLVTL